MGVCPDGRGVRFLRLKDKRVFTRQDVVVHQDTMPFRGVGGLVKSPTFHVNATAVPDADLIMSVRWDLDEHAEPAAEEISPGSVKTVVQGTAQNGVAPTPVTFRLDTTTTLTGYSPLVTRFCRPMGHG